ncbi:zinc-binding dehydrogenase [Propionimicrobium lymphophilum]|uniref:zinc-binding dehydrogenase n=1 Tax=Propionimicrobium lymphophilum TaxID=33012 RepID=UPI003EC5CA1D
MKAAIFNGPGDLNVKEVPTPEAGPGEIVLRVGANTVCGTDGRILRGEKTAGVRKGVVLGHEISGYVCEVGSGIKGFNEGDLVGVMPTVPCGKCFYCIQGYENLCTDSELFGYGYDGGLAEYIKIPNPAITRGGIFKVASHLDPVEVSLAEPLGCVLNGADLYEPKISNTVVIIGAGPIGLLHIQVCLHAGASRVIVSDPSEERRSIAEKFGATLTIDPNSENLVERVRDYTNGIGADIAIVCIGHPGLFNDALKVVRKRGTVSAFAGFSKTDLAQVDPNLIHYGELKVTGASNASRKSHRLALDLIEQGAIDVKSLHTNTFLLDAVVEGIQSATTGHGIKTAIVPN